MTFGDALAQLKAGGYVRRPGFDEGVSLFLVPGSPIIARHGASPKFHMLTEWGKVDPWVRYTSADLLAEDWEPATA